MNLRHLDAGADKWSVSNLKAAQRGWQSVMKTFEAISRSKSCRLDSSPDAPNSMANRRSTLVRRNDTGRSSQTSRVITRLQPDSSPSERTDLNNLFLDRLHEGVV